MIIIIIKHIKVHLTGNTEGLILPRMKKDIKLDHTFLWSVADRSVGGGRHT